MNGQQMPLWLMKRAHLTPNRIALIDGAETLTFRELDARVRDVAKRFMSLGIKPGDHVGLLSRNGIHTVCIIHALQYVGAVLVPLNIRLSPAELTWQLNDAEVTLLVYDESQYETVQTIVKRLDSLQTVSWYELINRPLSEDAFEIRKSMSLDDVHAIMYTSGTTGHPKGVLLTYGNHWWSAISSSLNLGLDAHDRWLLTVPMFHMSGMSIVLRSVIYGIAVVVHQAFEPDKVNDAICRQQISLVSVVNTMLAEMVEALGTGTYPSTLRCVLLGGGPASQSLLELTIQKKIPVFQTYGLTETASQVATLAPDDMVDKRTSAGKPLFPVELQIMDDTGALPPGKAGEIVVRGPIVTRGYWKQLEETKRAIRDGWLYTGDIGYLDKDGFLYVLDRRSDLIISGGENVYPAEIEAVLQSHGAVLEAGVTAKDDERWGQVPIAFVKLRPDVSVKMEELFLFCQDKLARYKIPVEIHPVPALPRNSTGKLIRRRLKDFL